MLLNQGQKIKTIYDESVEIIKFLASGGQGEVYEVLFRGEHKALKWYTCKFFDENGFYNNLKNNANTESPSKEFLWPLAVTEKCYGSFGYVMDLIPPGYYEVDKYTLASVKFVSFKAAVEACIQINSAFRILHLKGYAYQDLSGGNFVINPDKGNVLICDNDNVAPDGVSTGILGTPGFMAPEVVLGKSLPNKRSDQFSMAVLFFMLLCGNHPLEGKRWSDIVCMTDEAALRLYGTQPLFVYDPDDNSNEPVIGIHNNVIARWNFLPQYMKDVFIKAFSGQAMGDPNRRVSEFDWLQVLCRFRSDIVKCKNPACKGEVFINNADSTKCDCCGMTYQVNNKIILPMYEIPSVSGARIYKCQLGVCSLKEALDPMAAIVSKGEDLGIRNKSGMIWSATTPSGKSKKVEPDEVIPIRKGISFKIGDKSLEIK